jgi:hypothetical protein
MSLPGQPPSKFWQPESYLHRSAEISKSAGETRRIFNREVLSVWSRPMLQGVHEGAQRSKGTKKRWP